MHETLFPAEPTPLSTDEWYTPQWLFRAAGVTFDLDVCAPLDPMLRTCPAHTYYTVHDDGLTQPWHGLVWMNPPYSRAEPWVQRWAQHPDALAILPALPEVAWRGILLRAAAAVALIAADFGRPDGSRARLRWPLLLAGRGAGADLVPRIATADRYADGAYHVRPEVTP